MHTRPTSGAASRTRNIRKPRNWRTESVRAFNDGNTKLLIDLDVYLAWADAASRNDTIRATIIASRFTPEFKPAFKAWIAQSPGRPQGTIPNGTPFMLPEYRIDAKEQGALLEKNANAAFVEAQNASDISTSYVMTTLLFAIVLFLCGVGEKWEDLRFRKVILGTAILFFSLHCGILTLAAKTILKSGMT